jgi:large subunit ribosomal protein L19
MNKLNQFNKSQLKELPEIRPGYTVKVYQKIKEGEKVRIQPFEGLVIARKHGKGINATITVRKISHGVGVERIFPIHSPLIEKIEVLKKHKVRRAKLYYIRHKAAKEARLKEIK